MDQELIKKARKFGLYTNNVVIESFGDSSRISLAKILEKIDKFKIYDPENVYLKIEHDSDMIEVSIRTTVPKTDEELLKDIKTMEDRKERHKQAALRRKNSRAENEKKKLKELAKKYPEVLKDA